MKYQHAIVRKPARSMVEGITTGMFSTETPVYEKALQQHAAYVSALEELGVKVLVLDALEQYPDSCFVEDPAVVMEECAIVTNSPAASRHGEKQEILTALQKYYSPEQIFALTPPANMEGGRCIASGQTVLHRAFRSYQCGRHTSVFRHRCAIRLHRYRGSCDGRVTFEGLCGLFGPSQSSGERSNERTRGFCYF